MQRGGWVFLVTPVLALAIMYALITSDRFPPAMAAWSTLSPLALQTLYWKWLNRFPLQRAYGLPLLGALLPGPLLGLLTYASIGWIRRGGDAALIAAGMCFAMLLFTWKWRFRNYHQD